MTLLILGIVVLLASAAALITNLVRDDRRSKRLGYWPSRDALGWFLFSVSTIGSFAGGSLLAQAFIHWGE